MLFFVYLLADLDESKQMDSILKAVGAVKYEYGGWEIANFDTLPLSDSIPAPDGEYRIVDDYKALHLRGVWEYKDKSWRTELLMPGMASDLRGYPLDLLDWGRYLVFYIRGKGRYNMGFLHLHNNLCLVNKIRNLSLSNEWQEIRINLDSGYVKYDVSQFSSVFYDSPGCFYRREHVPLRVYITPLADTFGTYEYEIELSPIYLVR